MSEPITRIIFRRGLDSERKQITLNQGEPGYAVDTNRLFVGDGQTLGGIAAGTRFLGFTTFGTTNSFVDPFKGALSGDFVFDFGTTLLYVLTGNDYTKTNNYAPLGTSYTVFGSTTIDAPGNILEVKANSLDFSFFNSTAVGQGLELDPTTTIRIATPSPELSIVDNKLAITNNGITNDKLDIMPPDTLKGKLTVAGTPTDIPLLALAQILAPLINSQPTVATVPVGTILDYSAPEPPAGYLICDGQAVSRAFYASLFAVIGTRWGIGDGATTFNIPDLRRRVTAGSGGVSLSDVATSVGSVGGAENVLLTANQTGLRQHSHTGTILVPLNHVHSFAHQHIVGRAGGGDDGNFAFRNGITSIGGNLFPNVDSRQSITGDGGGGQAAENWNALTSVNDAYITSNPMVVGSVSAPTTSTPINDGTQTSISFTTAIANAQPALEAHSSMQPTAIVSKIIKY